jgi:hypothetical protein
MAEWYDFNANAVDANANAVDANANEVEANNANNINNANAVEANANAVEANAAVKAIPDHYRCDCGCNLDFIDYEPGFDVYVGDTWLITANAMVEYNWGDYIRMHAFNIWHEMRENIIINYNHALQNEPVKAADAPWIHLYNREINVNGDDIPLNEKIYYEYAY